MGVQIHIPADEVWSFFQKNTNRLSEEMVAIAENTDTEYAVYLTEEEGYPFFAVCKGTLPPEYEEGAIDEQDCTDTVKKCCLQYLFPVTVSSGSSPLTSLDEADPTASPTLQEMEDMIYEREDELMLALGDFLQIVLQESCDGPDVVDLYGMEFMNTILDHILVYLAEECALPIYRPTFITDESGCEIYLEYPYEEEEEPLTPSPKEDNNA